MIEFIAELWKIELVRKAVASLIYILISYLVIKAINAAIKKSNKKNIHMKFVGRILQALVVIICFVTIGMMFEATKQLITTVIASSAFLVVILGFAAQEALSNILSGILISVFRPFEIGDRLHLSEANITGIVEDISLRHTVLRTFNNSKLLIPNSVINKEIIENFHYNDARSGNFLDVQITFDSDITKAKEIMQRLIENHPNVIDMRNEQEIKDGKPKVLITVREIGDSGIWLRGTVWTKSVDLNFSTCSELRQQIVEEFAKEGVNIAFNTIVVKDK